MDPYNLLEICKQDAARVDLARDIDQEHQMRTVMIASCKEAFKAMMKIHGREKTTEIFRKNVPNYN
jgi:hypothetical protein